MARHVRKGDTVMVIAGDNKGKTGEVLRVLPKDDRVVVKGLNLRVKHIKPSRLAPHFLPFTPGTEIIVANAYFAPGAARRGASLR